MSKKELIFQILKKKSEVNINEIVEKANVSRQFAHRVLKTLIDSKEIIKIGSAPRTFYRLSREIEETPASYISKYDKEYLEKHFILVTETGSKLTGIVAFHAWCKRRNLPSEKTLKEYILTTKKYLKYYAPNGLISGMDKLKGTKGFDQIGLDELYYLDFYAIERFGKTKLGTLLHFAKQGQNQQLMAEIIEIIKDRVHNFIQQHKIDAVGYIPPTIKREVQIMKVLEKKLNISLPHVKIVKVSGEIAVPQKALSKIEDRISNARFSIVVQDDRKFKKILLIDDAVGSGATMNETAIKIKSNKVADEVTGMAVTGSFKGFEVIREI